MQLQVFGVGDQHQVVDVQVLLVAVFEADHHALRHGAVVLLPDCTVQELPAIPLAALHLLLPEKVLTWKISLEQRVNP